MGNSDGGSQGGKVCGAGFAVAPKRKVGARRNTDDGGAHDIRQGAQKVQRGACGPVVVEGKHGESVEAAGEDAGIVLFGRSEFEGGAGRVEDSHDVWFEGQASGDCPESPRQIARSA